MSNRDHTALAVGASIAIVVTLSAAAVGLEAADSPNTIALMTLLGTLMITPVLGVLFPLIRGVNRAAATGEETANGVKQIRQQLNGELDARLQQAVERGTRSMTQRIDRIERRLADSDDAFEAMRSQLTAVQTTLATITTCDIDATPQEH
jgi:LytS/YehU family sensor histidine kinase